MTEREILKLALEAFEAKGDAWIVLERKAITAIKEALAQPALASEQEPVACVQDLDEVKRKHLVYEKGMDWKDPLYTTPTQRTWVGLTDVERRQAVNEVTYSQLAMTHAEWVHEVQKATEAKLKEKNT